MADEKPIIIIKKKGGHGGHHGGAWKVAYADFVTAMMAFFMVMWLVNSADVTTKQNIASYFKRPGIFQEGSGTPLLLGQAGILNDAYVPAKKVVKSQSSGKLKAATDQETGGAKGASGKGAGIEQEDAMESTVHSDNNAGLYKENKKSADTEKKVENPEDAEAVAAAAAANAALEAALAGRDAAKLQGGPAQSGALGESVGEIGGKDKGLQGDAIREALLEKKMLEATAKEIKEMVKRSPELEALLGVVDVKIEDNGLNIEIMDTQRSSMFALGSAQVLPQAAEAFSKITKILATLPNKIDILGHTDSKPFSNRPGGYSNWELSADRANTARRILEREGIPADRIISVVGRADRDLRKDEEPLDASNRRITLRVRFDKEQLPPNSTWEADPDIRVIPEKTGNNHSVPTQASPAGDNAPEPVHSFTPQEITNPNPASKSKAPAADDLPTKWEPKNKMSADNSQKRKTFALPDAVEGADLSAGDAPAQNNSIFGNNPVLDPSDPFAD